MKLVPAVVGIAADGPFAIDLAADGPHALVGGTTGSGKSELLQTLVASLAVTAPPTEVTFLLIDYKGGAAFRECTALPHVVGFVTDLDPQLARRVLVSLEAEIRSREAVLAEHSEKDLDRLKAAHPEAAPPRLLILVDEFATLAREIPEFIDGIVDVAQRGRSLGVHLVLATQRPAGVITPTIRANTNLRIALRTSDPMESDDIIGIADAARIPRTIPGRAYARIGHGQVIEFQSGYVGRRLEPQRKSAPHAAPFRFGAQLQPIADQRSAQGDAGPTELSAMVSAVSDAARELEMPAPRRPWLPPLPAIIPLDTIPQDPHRARIAFGTVDEPDRQQQRPLELDLEADGGMILYGAAGSGKTNALRAATAALALTNPAAGLHAYGIDFGTGGLRPLEALPHVGAVIPGVDEERVTRLLRRLQAEMVRRQEQLSAANAFNLSDYVSAGGEGLPRLLLLLDGYEAFAHTYERVALGELIDLIPRLASDGRSVGIHVLLTAERRASVPGRLAGAFASRLVFRLADPSEYAYLGIPRKLAEGIDLPPGRGFTHSGLEAQVAVLERDPHPAAQAAALSRLASGMDDRGRAATIAALPTTISLGDLPAPDRPLRAVLGVGDTAVTSVEIDLSESGFLVLGPYRSGRSTALATLAISARRGTPGLRLFLLAPRASPLRSLDLWSDVASSPGDGDRLLGSFPPSADRPDASILIVVDDAEEMLEGTVATQLATIVRGGRGSGVHLMAAAEMRSASRAYAGWLPDLAKGRHGLLLQPPPDATADILGATLPRRSGRPLPPGRGYYIRRGSVELVQVAQPIGQDGLATDC
jgi:S-DNA-T family DNA segregation ATPase FtsK/SpoIIIE